MNNFNVLRTCIIKRVFKIVELMCYDCEDQEHTNLAKIVKQVNNRHTHTRILLRFTVFVLSFVIAFHLIFWITNTHTQNVVSVLYVGCSPIQRNIHLNKNAIIVLKSVDTLNHNVRAIADYYQLKTRFVVHIGILCSWSRLCNFFFSSALRSIENKYWV